MCVSKNTAAEAYEEERMNASGRRTRLAVRRLRLESTRAAKISQGRGFHQENGTTNRLFRNTQKKKEKRKCRLSGEGLDGSMFLLGAGRGRKYGKSINSLFFFFFFAAILIEDKALSFMCVPCVV